MNGMFTLIAIGFIGGLITGISPCILPVLPVIFFSGTQGVSDPVATKNAASAGGESGGSVATEAPPKASLSDRLRPYRVIAGLVLSFSIVTLAGSALLSLLHLPQDAIRWIALVALVAIGLGLIFPKVEELLEKPFAQAAAEAVRVGQRFRSRPGTRRALRAVRGSRAGGHRRRGCHRHDRARHGGVDPVVRASAPRCRCCSSRSPANRWPSASQHSAIASARSAWPRGS